MDYRKLADEAYKLYNAFYNVFLNKDLAFDLTKFCVKEFPIFREMVEEENHVCEY